MPNLELRDQDQIDDRRLLRVKAEDVAHRSTRKLIYNHYLFLYLSYPNDKVTLNLLLYVANRRLLPKPFLN